MGRRSERSMRLPVLCPILPHAELRDVGGMIHSSRESTTHQASRHDVPILLMVQQLMPCLTASTGGDDCRLSKATADQRRACRAKLAIGPLQKPELQAIAMANLASGSSC